MTEMPGNWLMRKVRHPESARVRGRRPSDIVARRTRRDEYKTLTAPGVGARIRPPKRAFLRVTAPSGSTSNGGAHVE